MGGWAGERTDVVLIDASIVSQAIAGYGVRSRRLIRVGMVTVETNLSLKRGHTTMGVAPVDGEGLPVLNDWQRWPLEDA